MRRRSTARGPALRGAAGSLLAALALLSLLAACGGHRDPTAASAQLDFGVQMARQGLWNEALFRFQQADRIDPRNVRVQNNIAVAYEALGEFDSALETYQAALKLAPNNTELRQNYTRFVEFYRSFRPAEDEGDDAPSDTEGGGEITR